MCLTSMQIKQITSLLNYVIRGSWPHFFFGFLFSTNHKTGKNMNYSIRFQMMKREKQSDSNIFGLTAKLSLCSARTHTQVYELHSSGDRKRRYRHSINLFTHCANLRRNKAGARLHHEKLNQKRYQLAKIARKHHMRLSFVSFTATDVKSRTEAREFTRSSRDP